MQIDMAPDTFDNITEEEYEDPSQNVVLKEVSTSESLDEQPDTTQAILSQALAKQKTTKNKAEVDSSAGKIKLLMSRTMRRISQEVAGYQLSDFKRVKMTKMQLAKMKNAM